MRFPRLERVECRTFDNDLYRTRLVRGEIMGPDQEGNPAWRHVILDEPAIGVTGIDRECNLRLCDLRKLSILELLAEAANAPE